MSIHTTPRVDRPQRSAERGSALLLAMILILILTFLGFGLLTRSMLVSQIAGAERWTTKAFFAADAGINLAKARLKVRQPAAFQLNVQDLRGYTSASSAGAIVVAVSDFSTVGPPIPDTGSQMGAGQGTSSEPLYRINYKGTANASADRTRSEAQITTTQNMAPVPLTITLISP